MSMASQLAVPTEALDAARSLAHAAIGARRFSDARNILEGCVLLDPQDDWSLQALATVALQQGDLVTAQKCAASLNQLVASQPSIALLIARILLAQNRKDEARGWLENVTRQGGEYAKVASAILKIVS